jgi:parallel beta-helix repeat protein
VALKLNGTTDGTYGINVTSGGKFYIYDNDNNPATTSDASNITNGDNSSFNYFFIINSGTTFEMKNSYLGYAGWENTVGKRGLEINTTVTEFSGNTLANNQYDGLALYSDNNIIFNNTFSSNYGDHMYLWYSDNNNVSNNRITFSTLGQGIYMYSCSGNNITNNTIDSTSGQSIFMYDSRYNNISNNVIYNSSSQGIALSFSSNNTLTNNIVSLSADKGI